MLLFGDAMYMYCIYSLITAESLPTINEKTYSAERFHGPVATDARLCDDFMQLKDPVVARH